jgi:hypothetical protein
MCIPSIPDIVVVFMMDHVPAKAPLAVCVTPVREAGFGIRTRVFRRNTVVCTIFINCNKMV